MSTISIVIPAYNMAQYLDESIGSAYNQTSSPLEIIVVNDGSTDNTQEVAERYMFKQFPGIESPVRVINQVNKGLPSARNTGIMAAQGDYIFFLDADDILVENAVASIESAIAQTNADMIAPSFRTFGKAETEVILTAPTIEELKVANRFGYFCAYKKSVLVECGGYSPRMRFGYEDYHLHFDMFTRNKSICILQEPLVYYRMKENSMIHDAQAHHEELMNQIKHDFPSVWK